MKLKHHFGPLKTTLSMEIKFQSEILHIKKLKSNRKVHIKLELLGKLTLLWLPSIPILWHVVLLKT